MKNPSVHGLTNWDINRKMRNGAIYRGWHSRGVPDVQHYIVSSRKIGILNFVNSQNSITFASEELYDSNEPQNIEIRTAAKSLP